MSFKLEQVTASTPATESSSDKPAVKRFNWALTGLNHERGGSCHSENKLGHVQSK